jgi:hypothetical protein
MCVRRREALSGACVERGDPGYGGAVAAICFESLQRPEKRPLQEQTAVLVEAANPLCNEQLSCSELTGFRVCSEHCCGDLERAAAGFGVLPCRALPGRG